MQYLCIDLSAALRRLGANEVSGEVEGASNLNKEISEEEVDHLLAFIEDMNDNQVLEVEEALASSGDVSDMASQLRSALIAGDQSPETIVLIDSLLSRIMDILNRVKDA